MKDNDKRLKKNKIHTIVPDLDYPGMWRVRYPDGRLSAAMYNQTRATEFCKLLDLNPKDSPIIGGAHDAQ